MTGNVLNIGFVGNGKSANRYHIPYILTRPDTLRVKTIYVRHLGSSPWTPVPGAVYTDDLSSMLRDPEIDVVVHSTPPASHYALAKQVLEAGKNCVSEKPFTPTAAQAKELFSLAKERGVMLQYYQNRRFDSDFLTVQKVIASGKLGDLYEMELCFDYFRPEIPEEMTAFDPGCTFLFGHGCHTIDQVISYFGIPEQVSYDVRQILGSGRMNDYFDVDLFFRIGTLKVKVAGSYFRAVKRPSFTVYGTRDAFIKRTTDQQETHMKHFYMPGQPGFGVDDPDEYGVLTWYGEDGGYHEEKMVSEVGDYGRYYDALYETLAHGAPQLVTPEETIAQIEILENGIAPLR